MLESTAHFQVIQEIMFKRNANGKAQKLLISDKIRKIQTKNDPTNLAEQQLLEVPDIRFPIRLRLRNQLRILPIPVTAELYGKSL